MASPNNSCSLPTNEQIIDDITKDVAGSLSINNEKSNPQSDTTKLDKENHTQETHTPEDFEKSDSEAENCPIPEDFVDEEKLKDLEVTLSEEDKLARQKSALDFKTQGNEKFKNEHYLESISFYTEGLRVCPLKFESDRAVLYANRAASKAKLDRSESAIEDCTKAIEFNSKYLKAYLRRAKLYEDCDKLEESLADYNKILELDPRNKDALDAQVRLPSMINQRNEKLKEEMLGKLKDLGNVLLKPFGLSTDSFKLTQDPNTGGYSMNFSQGTE